MILHGYSVGLKMKGILRCIVNKKIYDEEPKFISSSSFTEGHIFGVCCYRVINHFTDCSFRHFINTQLTSPPPWVSFREREREREREIYPKVLVLSDISYSVLSQRL